MQSAGAECFICLDDEATELVPMGCGCRFGVAHVECMARLARSRGTWRECPTCMRRLTGRMFYMLCGYPTETGKAVCNIHEALRVVVGSGIPVARAPTNDQTNFRIALDSSGCSAISVAAKLDGSGYQVAVLDTDGKPVPHSSRDFDATETQPLLLHVTSVLFRVACTEKDHA